MPMEKVSKYTKFFDLLVIGDEKNSGVVCEAGIEYFRSMRRIDFTQTITEPLSSHILIINGTLSEISAQNTRALGGQIQRIETFVLSDKTNIAVYKEAINYRAGYVGEYINNEQEFATMMLATLASIIKKQNDTEILVQMSPLGGAIKKSDKLFLNRISFIEILKDAFIVHKQEGEPIPVIIIRIENEAKVIEEFGEDVYNEVCKKIFEMAKKDFNAMASIALWHKDVFTIIDEGVSLDEHKECLERLHNNIAEQVSVNGATPILDSFVIDMSKLELNKAINIIDNINERELIATDLSRLLYHEVSFDDKSLDIKDQALHYLEKLFLSKSQMKLLNFYKGIRINTIGQIIKMTDGLVYMAIEKIQGYAMQVEKSIVIQGTNLPFDIAAEIKIVDIGKKVAIFRNFVPLKASANSRQHIRIQSDHRMHLIIKALKRDISALILDISINSIACRVNNVKRIPDIGTLVTLHFHLPSKRTEDGKVTMIVTGHIQFTEDMGEYTKVVILLDFEEPYESFLIEYLYGRQQELISEIKSIVSKL